MYSSSFFFRKRTIDRLERRRGWRGGGGGGEGRSIGDFRTPHSQPHRPHLFSFVSAPIVAAILLLYVILLVALRTRILGHAWKVLERTISGKRRIITWCSLSFGLYFIFWVNQHLHPCIFSFYNFFTIYRIEKL